MFRLVAARQPDAKDLGEMTSTLKELIAHYASHIAAAKQLIATGETKPDPRLDPGELAAWTLIGNILLNLDEAITKG
jgi:hypothetical protein